MTVRCHEILAATQPAYFYSLDDDEEDDDEETSPHRNFQHFIKLKQLILIVALVVLSNHVFANAALGVHAASPPSNSIISASALANRASILSLDITAQYVLPNNSYFQHLTYDRRRNVLYAGAMNRILQVNRNLTVLSQAVTGPKPDGPQCHAGGCSDDMDTVETNNYNKVLILDEASDTLVTCGSIHQGACEIYNNLNLFPESYKYLEFPLAANDENSTTYAFIGPSRYAAWKKEDILYVGTTFTNVGDYRHDVPAISSRKLDDLNYAEFSIQQSNMYIDVKYRDHFLVDYIYGFNSSDYAYFAIVQKKSHLAEEAGFQTRLARICVSDPNYDSYTEITIQCLAPSMSGNSAEHFYNDRTNEYHYPQQHQQPQSGAGGATVPGYTDFNILRDAKITRAGQRLSQSMGIKKDDFVLVTSFSPSKEITNEPQNTSAMCVFSLKEIEEVFTENIHMCFNGSIKDRNLGYISGTIMDGKCPAVGSYGNIFNFCSVGLKISGVAPIVAHSLFTFENESVTSVTTATTGPHTLAFLGTSEGTIKKVLISGPTPGEYERIDVDPGNQIMPDTQLSPKQDYLYVLSRKKITKLRVEHCGIYTNCSSCLESRDPFCGWCSLEKRCTVRSACQRDTSASRWLSLGTGQQCIDFEMVLPDKIPINEMASVQLIIRTLPELPFNAKYKCVFGNSTPIDANVTENGLVCMTPSLKQRPQIEGNNDHVSVLVSVRSSETNKDFVSRNFAFFDCSRHDTCRQCVKSEWYCNWCVYDNKCVHNTTACRNTANVVTVESSCPHFKHSSQPILLPNKVPKEIKLEIENLPRPQSAHTGFLCTVNIEGAHMVLPARVESNKYIVCEKTPYSYEANTNEFEAKVDVNWNRNHYIDTVSIILYKCDVLGSHREHADCSLCVTRDPKYQCSWCNNQCVYNETCVFGHVNECPKPRIDMIKPLSGPIEGGTLITIEGSNLGIREEDVRGKIRIGDVPCELVNYEISVKIECRTGGISYELTAPVKVGNEAGYTESSVQFQYKDIKLQGLSPSMGPQSGGTQVSIIGRYLNIGSNIIAYLDDYVCLINVTQASSSRLTCITSAAKAPERIRTLTLVIDGANRTLQCNDNGNNNNNYNRYNPHQQYQHHKYNQNYNNYYDNEGDQCSIYNYTVDPKIMQIKPLKSFISGGRMITVHGSNLDSIQKPEIEVYLDDERINKSTCYVLHSTQMECPSPSVIGKFQSYFAKLDASRDAGSGGGNNDQRRQQQLRHKRFAQPQFDNSFTTSSSYAYSTVGGSGNGNDVAALKIQDTALSFQLSFIMDNVQSVKDLNKHFQSLRSNIIYMEDPDFFPFANHMKLYKGDTLVIEGNNLNIASDESDVNVTIGMMQCNVTSLALTQLVCTPPEQQPAATDENGVQQSADLPLVVVRVGRTLRFPIGHLRYDLMKPYSFSHAMAGIIVGITLIVFLLCVVLFVYRRKSTQAEREYKRIQIQMDTLESNVRMECKQAFAELQTDMTDLTADLENSGIPNLDHVHYIMKVFFPGVTDHPILNTPKMQINTPRTNYDTAMIQFEQLINNKNFILVFIETLEAQKTFNIRDKVNVASLLMIVLMNKMEYATDILKCLLHRLIDKSVQTKHPQLMLRRTESVVEKMLTNYMALCMYDYLKEYSGTSLFLLFKAIKHQIEKGLVDAITNDARYSLSEERLLREQIEHSVVTLHIVQEDLDEKIQCKVLDCDTITQVKLKILDALFKNTPFSMRPSVYDVDLEWRHGRGGHLTLQDEDLTTKTIQGWRRLNTLAHYGVKESAVMSLIAKQSSEGYQVQYNSKSSSYPNCYYINNPQSHMIINGDLDSAGMHHHHHHMMHQPNAPHLISPHQQMAPPLPPPITHPPPSTLPNSYHNHHSHHHHMPAAQHHHHPQAHQYRVYHLVKPQADDFCLNSTMKPSSAQGSHNHHQAACNERTHKAIPEIFLTRLLATKGTLQKFVDDFFTTILTVNDELPPAVKWLFDFLDEEARLHGINDPEVVHAWKSNSLPLRFWVNFIKNPDFIFDINKTTTVDGCLSVIAQTFMDSCSTTDHRLGKDSPSNKLLFAKDIPQYRNMVAQFYIDIAHLPQISEQEMCTQMQQLSIQNHDEFDTISALKELYIYVTNYRDQILDALDSDPNCKKMHLAHKLENVACTLEEKIEYKSLEYYGYR